jgi:ribosomal protein RSM22 (predicted rRNA methylase)
MRDLPKATAAVRELPLRAPLRLLDLGAGLGAATWGIARALGRGEVHATLVDDDSKALALATAIAKERQNREGDVTVNIETVTRDVNAFDGGNFDLAIAQNVLTEIGASADADADRLQRWLSLVREDGSLVIVEPALKTRTRHLHEVRDRLASRGVTIFAPCLHARPCPMLKKPEDWCHEDLAIDLPEWLVPLAREAGLRWQGLTFSYLVLRRDSVRLASRLPAGAFRAVSRLVATKGKKELQLCGARVFVDARRLDRDESPQNEAWDSIQRGDLLTLEPSPTADGAVRVGKDCAVVSAVAVDDGSARS